ncbi:MAG: DUF1501 domain-containing protein [Cellvibrionaceae bacterium]
MDRRAFIKASALTSMAAIGPWVHTRQSWAAPGDWGALPADNEYWPTGTARPEYKILEIHLSGGLSAYETFYVNSALPVDERWYGLQSEVAAINWSACTPSAPPSSTHIEPFFGDIGLGPATAPLWPFKNDMRLVTLWHGLEPHEAAIPFSLTGLPLGNAKLSGLAAAIEHRYDRSLTLRTTPYSYILMPGNLGIDNDSFQGFHATGIHGGQFRPVVLRFPEPGRNPDGTVNPGRDDSLLNALNRSGITSSSNQLLRQFAAQYKDRLRHSALPSVPARSSEFNAYNSALATLVNAPDLRTVLDTALVETGGDISCVDPLSGGREDANLTRAQINTAARLLSLSEADGGARYVGMVDGGIRPTTGGGYDVHSIDEYPNMYTSLWNCLSSLAEVLYKPAPGDPIQPNKINLNDTLVILNTEFGREPAIGLRGGRDHWPYGYVNVLIGGPVSQGIAGTIGNDGRAVSMDSYTPTDLRAALLMAAGIDPFNEANFGVGDVSQAIRSPGGGSEEGSAQQLRERILGVV